MALIFGVAMFIHFHQHEVMLFTKGEIIKPVIGARALHLEQKRVAKNVNRILQIMTKTFIGFQGIDS